jgi:rhodanese-related sulfurtransferase
VVDLRGLDEAPQSPFAAARRLSVGEIEALLEEPPPAGRIVLCCRSGQRALAAADRLRQGGRDRLALVALG